MEVPYPVKELQSSQHKLRNLKDRGIWCFCLTPQIINKDRGGCTADTWIATRTSKKKPCHLKAEAPCSPVWSSSPHSVLFLQAARKTSCTFLVGFTAMTEKFSRAMYMDRGAEQLVEILNHYISAIVESKTISMNCFSVS